MALLTVAIDTPAIFATSSIVAGLDEEFSKNRNTFAKNKRALPPGAATILIIYQNGS